MISTLVNTIKQDIRHALRNLSLSLKIILTMVLLALTIMVSFSVYFYTTSASMLDTQGRTIVKSAAGKNAATVSKELDSVENSARTIIGSTYLDDFLERAAADQFVNDNESFDFQTTVLPKLREVFNANERVTSVKVCYGHTIYEITPSSTNHFETKTQQPNNVAHYWGHDQTGELYYHLPYGQYQEDALKRGWVDVYTDPNAGLQLSNRDEHDTGVILLGNDDKVLYMSTKNRMNRLSTMRENQVKETNKYIWYREQISENGLSLFTYYSRAGFSISFSKFLWLHLPIILMLLIFIIASGIVFARWITHPLNSLVRAMDITASSELPKPVHVHSKDEIGQLSSQFNRMVTALNEQMDEIREKEQLKRDAELHAFQSQIQPHFLYNTLAIISWTAKREGSHDAEVISNNLAKYYRLVLAKGASFVSLYEEIELVRYYLEIQMIRFEDQLDATIDVDPDIDVQCLQIMHRILQPLAENAIEHGVFPKGTGKIRITVAQSQGFLYIIVADDGAGTSPEIVEKIRHHIPIAGVKGFSLAYIFATLINFYGDSVCIDFCSYLGEGTYVMFRFKLKALLPAD